MFFTVFLAFAVSCQTTAVKKSPAMTGIIPGIGSGPLRLGMSPDEVRNVLGENPGTVSYENEYQAYINFDYVPENELVFQIGFDYLLEYSADTNLTNIPAWKLFFKDERLVYINYTSFIFPETPSEFNGIKPAAVFMGTKEDMEMTLGNEYIRVNGGNDNFYYLEKGVLIIFVDNELRVIHIFKPISPQDKEMFNLKDEIDTQEIDIQPDLF